MKSNLSDWAIGDDWISIPIPELHLVHDAFGSVHGQSPWIETVPGFDSLVVQFDPEEISGDEAVTILQRQLEKLERSGQVLNQPITLPICFAAEFGPDQEFVADHVGYDPTKLSNWFYSLDFSVAMLGFMPGFAYLQCSQQVPEIGRLDQPRQKIVAGSVGIIGDQACIYSFDSPGGWPIIGRTPLQLYDNERAKPALLSPGQEVRFEPISLDVFNDIQSGQAKWC